MQGDLRGLRLESSRRSSPLQLGRFCDSTPESFRQPDLWILDPRCSFPKPSSRYRASSDDAGQTPPQAHPSLDAASSTPLASDVFLGCLPSTLAHRGESCWRHSCSRHVDFNFAEPVCSWNRFVSCFGSPRTKVSSTRPELRNNFSKNNSRTDASKLPAFESAPFPRTSSRTRGRDT